MRAASVARGDHQEERLAEELDRSVAKQRLVGAEGEQSVVPGQVGRRQHRDDARRRAHRGEVERASGPCGSREAEGEMQAARGSGMSSM